MMKHIPLNASQRITFLFLVLLTMAGPARAGDPLAEGFAKPPEETKPWCYWYWISDNISKEGITRDLEAMSRVGIGEALIGNIFLTPEYGATVPVGNVKVLSPEWWSLVEHAIREGGRVGVNIGLFNCPGWSQSGGPWIKPEQTMRYLASSEVRVTGPRQFAGKLPAPKEHFQDVAVLAFPAPQNDADTLSARAPRITCNPPLKEANHLADGRLDSAVVVAEGAALTIDIELAEPMTARSLQLFPSDYPFSADVELLVMGAEGSFQTLRRFKCDWSNFSPAVGFIPQAPATISFAATTSRQFRLLLTNITPGHRNFVPSKGAALAEINLCGAARLESFVEKQLGKMHPTPLPNWDTYLWPTPADPESAKLTVPTAGVRNLSKHLAADGTLRWDVPPGEWVIQRIGMTPTGMSNSPASVEGRGFEVDKMNRALAQHHFDAFVGELLRRMPAADRKAFKRVVADSYEMGAQNWTDDFGKQFAQRYGYDPKPWLPVLTGRIVGSADQSERFLWDLRRLVADRVATDYVGGLRDAANRHGLGLWLENYGHWGFPGEFLKYGGASDRVAGEYWVTGDLGSIECRAASSCANTYGKKFVSAESWTGGPPFQNAPADLKARGDWSFCEGVNHVVLHVYIHQPWEDKKPGVNAPWGTEFNRHNTWFAQSGTWIEYLRRSSWLLQQGHRVADVAYFIGDDAPKMTGGRNPELPRGRDFDYINSEVIEKSLAVKNGLLQLPHGTTYQVLVLPNSGTMRPEVLRKIRNLVKAGATVLGPPAARSPSMENFPKCDAEVRQLARELWGEADLKQSGERQFGKGRIIWGKTLEQVFASQGLPPDFESSTLLRYTHRRSGETDIYFVANPKGEALTATVALRAGDRIPELWWPDSGRIERPGVYDEANGIVRLPLTFGPHGSVFVVLREPSAFRAERIVSVTHDGEMVLDTKLDAAMQRNEQAVNSFTLAAWVDPAADTGLLVETNHGAAGLGAVRNEVITPTHGSQFGDPDRHAGAGLAVGRNGVVVFEHAASHFAPVLVWPAAMTNWTHVAVVYRDGEPSLYLGGKLVHRGQRSGFVVHPGVKTEESGGSFDGKVGGFRQSPQALEEAELAQWMQATPRTRTGPIGDRVRLERASDGRVFGWAEESGDYGVQFAEGRKVTVKVPLVPSPVEIVGPWEVTFGAGEGAAHQTVFDRLINWTSHTNEAIRFYSGRVTYRKAFEMSAQEIGPRNDARIVLDLGEVRDLATVRVNGREFGPLWIAPWRVDITGAIQPGSNQLEVEVVNVWNNRLVGDAGKSQTQRQTLVLVPTVEKDAPLRPAGIIGPVTLHFSRAFSMP